MKSLSTVALLAGMGLPFAISAQTGGPAIAACGDLLPEGSHYSLSIDLDWDRRGETTTGEMSLTLTDERTGRRPETVPDEAAEFVDCVRDALEIPSEEW